MSQVSMQSLQKYCEAMYKVDECEDCEKHFHVSCANLSEKESVVLS